MKYFKYIVVFTKTWEYFLMFIESRLLHCFLILMHINIRIIKFYVVTCMVLARVSMGHGFQPTAHRPEGAPLTQQ